jgi:hypothetical protein
VALFEARFDPSRTRPAGRLRGAGRRAESRRSRARSTPSRASTRTASCGRSSAPSGHPAHQLLPGRVEGGRSRTSPSSSTRTGPRPARPGRGSRSGSTAPGRGRAPAVRPGRPRWAALVRPPRGLPHRGARPGQGADGEERRHRAGRRKGGFVVQAPPVDPPTARRAGRGHRLLPHFISGLLDVTDNLVRRRRQRSCRRPGRPPRRDDTYLVVAADKGTATFSDIANQVAHDYGFWLGRRVRLRRVGRLRPQGDGHHRARCLGVGETATSASWGSTPSPKDFTWSAIGDMSGDGFGQRDAVCRSTSACSSRSTTGTCSEPGPRRRDVVRRATPPVPIPASLFLGRLRPVPDLGGCGVYRGPAKSIPISDQVRSARAPAGVRRRSPRPS